MNKPSGMLKPAELASSSSGRDRDGGRRLHRPLRPAARQALRRRDVRRRGRQVAAATPATISSPSTWRWSRCPATRSPTGSSATATSTSCPTWRRCACASWLEKTALVAVRRQDEKTHDYVPVAPRSILRRQVDAAREAGLRGVRRDRARALPLPHELPRRRAAGLPRPRARRLVPRGLPHPAGHAHRGLPRRGAAPPQALRRAGRELEGRMGPRPARAQRALRRSARHGRPPRRLQAVPEGGRRGRGHERHLHGQARRRRRRARAATSTSACGATARTRFPATSSSAGECSDEFRWFLGGWIAHVPGRDGVLRADRSTPTSATSTPRGRRRGSPGATTTAPPASASSATATSLRIECRIPGADCNPYLAFAAALASGPRRHRATRSSRRSASSATSTPRSNLPRVPYTLARGDRRVRSERVRQAGVRRRRRRALRALLPHRAAAFDKAVTDWERRRYFERI